VAYVAQARHVVGRDAMNCTVQSALATYNRQNIVPSKQEAQLSQTGRGMLCVIIDKRNAMRLSDIKFAVILCIFLCVCSVTNISAELQPIGVQVCTTVDLSSRQSLSPFGGDIFRGHEMRDQKKEKCRFFGPMKSYLTANISKTVSRSVTFQLELNTSLTRAI